MATETYRLFPSVRLGILCLAFIGCFTNNVSWLVLNFSMVCMVNATYLKREDHNFSTNSDCSQNQEGIEADYGGTLPWSRQTQSNLLSAEAWCGTVLAVPVAIIINRYGIKKLYIACTVIAGIASALTPIAAINSHYYVLLLRMIFGACTILPWPACIIVANTWFAEKELGSIMAVIMCGFLVGSTFAMEVSGAICSTIGWQYVFYLSAAISFLTALFWLLFYSDSVENSGLISEAEKQYILHTRNKSMQSLQFPVPYRSMLTSRAVWSIIAAVVASFYLMYFFADFLATYMKEVLMITALSNGIMSGLPFLCQLCGRLIGGFLSDYMSNHWTTPNLTVKTFGALSGYVPALVVLLLILFDCTKPNYAITLLCIGYLFFGLSVGGFPRSTCLVAPQFAGIISCLTTGVSFLVGTLTPYITAAMTPVGTPPEWQRAFIVTGVIGFVGTTIFVIFGSAKLESWAEEADSALIEEENVSKI